MPDQERKVEDFFSAFAPKWDTLYGAKRNLAWRFVDAAFRRDVYERYAFTFQTMGDDLRGLTVLDAGCGNGLYCIEAAKRGADRVVGVDVAPGMIEIANRGATAAGVQARCNFIVGQFPEASGGLSREGAFDYAILTGVLDYIQSPGPFLAALKPLVRRALIASVPGAQPVRYFLRRTRYRLLGRPDVYHYSQEDVNRMFSEGGFRIKSVTHWSHSGGCYMVVAE
jgi:2-polyprenyl-3-methyl-5-hydroxy-6-metoxy-1,4-benzoquinol methylase